MDIQVFNRAVDQIAKQRGIPPKKVIETLEAAIAAAYKKDYGKKGEVIEAKLNPETGEVEFWQVKEVVDESMIYSEEELEELKKGERAREGNKVVFNPQRHILVDEAKKNNPKVKPGDEIKIPLKTQEEYGRIAAQTAKQVILQKIREAEKETIYEEYKEREGDIISGLVQRIERDNVLVDIGKTLGVLPREEQVREEFYRPGQRLKFYVLQVEESPKGPRIFLSRSHPKLISKLFELEVPEISAGTVEIKSIAREPGFRTKIAVTSTIEGIDPIGACVGQRGTRIMAVINEIDGEKIDVVEWSDKPEEYIANALSPAKALEVKIGSKNTAQVMVPEDQLSLAIGKDGRNVRLAVNLTGWKIDVKAQKAPGKEKEEIEEKPEKEETKEVTEKKTKKETKKKLKKEKGEKAEVEEKKEKEENKKEDEKETKKK